MKPTTSNLIRFAGLAAVPAGIVFAGIQPIHPPDVVESVSTSAWAIITSLKFAMCLFFLVGITGLYTRQVEKAGWLGLSGFALLAVSWWLLTAFVFAEAFVLPRLAGSVPEFVDALLGISYGHTGGGGPRRAAHALFGRRRDQLHAWRPAVWHRNFPCRRPAALAGGSASHRGRADSTGGTPPARRTAVRRDPRGLGSGLVGLCALLRAAN